MPCQSGLYTAARNENTNYVPAHTLVNGRLTWRNPGGELDVSLEVANLMDKYYRLTVFDQTSGQGAVAEQPGRARMGLERDQTLLCPSPAPRKRGRDIGQTAGGTCRGVPAADP
ncbi:uncharacterized protein PY1_contig-17-102 [Novosphingobium sp. PY1]|nr:hypothetical protein [Novosphingobium sp. PY1]GFM31405.1 uncharacterized protein PY1_contig-17-102 [Novosphingobium sp. PY1]